MHSCDMVVTFPVGIILLFTQHDWQSNAWSAADKGHVAVGGVLVIVGVANMALIVVRQRKVKIRRCLVVVKEIAERGLGVGLIGVGIVILMHYQPSEYAKWLHFAFAFAMILTGCFRFFHSSMPLSLKLIGCYFAACAGTILVLASKPTIRYFQESIHPFNLLLITFVSTGFIFLKYSLTIFELAGESSPVKENVNPVRTNEGSSVLLHNVEPREAL